MREFLDQYSQLFLGIAIGAAALGLIAAAMLTEGGPFWMFMHRFLAYLL